MAPIAASTGARTAPTTPAVTGNSATVLPPDDYAPYVTFMDQ